MAASKKSVRSETRTVITPELAFGQILKERRKSKGYTQLDIEAMSDVARSYISELEAGKRQVCLRAFMQLAFSLEMTPGELMDGIVGRMDKQLLKRMQQR